MAQNDWYYAQQGRQNGPVSFEQLGQLARGGQLSPADLIWREGMPNWTPASQTPGLFNAAPEAPTYDMAPQPATSAYAPAGAVYAPPRTGTGAQIGYYAPQPGYVEYAGFWLRFCAFVLDQVLLFVVNFFIGFVIGFALASASKGAGVILIQVIGIVVSWLYYASMESSTKQATLGKMALGIVVTDLNGERIGFGKATGRYFGKIVSGLILCIGYIMAGFTERKQALHDMMAGTLVIKGRRN